MVSSLIQYESRMKNWENKEDDFRKFFKKEEHIQIRDLKRDSIDETKFADHLKDNVKTTSQGQSIDDDNKITIARSAISKAIRDQSVIVNIFAKWDKYEKYEKAEVQKVDSEIEELRQALAGTDIDRSLKACNTLIMLLRMEEKVESYMLVIEKDIERLEMDQHKDLIAFLNK